MMAIVGAAGAFGILFASKTFPLPYKARLRLSILATVTIGFFAEFRNEGKFFFKNSGHFFGPRTWIHDGLNQVISSSGDFLYRMEFSHWNDFLIGPAIVSVMFSVAFMRIYGAFRDEAAGELDDALRFARILMNVGLFWFFIQAWAEKA